MIQRVIYIIAGFILILTALLADFICLKSIDDFCCDVMQFGEDTWNIGNDYILKIQPFFIDKIRDKIK